MTSATDLRFGVVGAGAAGIAAADALRRRGCRNITVLEREPGRVGGKCRTVPFAGVPMDTGAIYVLPHYPLVDATARRVGVTLRPASPFVHFGVDGRTRPFGTPPRPISLLAKTAEYGRLGLQLLRYRSLLACPLSQASPALVRELALPLARWIEAHRLDHFHEVAYPLLRSFGFGFEEQEIPAVYIFNILPRLAHKGNLASLWDPSSVQLQLVQEGYGELWRRVAAGLDVRLGAEVRSIERGGKAVQIRTATGDLEVDRLILACPLDEALGFLDASAEERRLLAKIRWFPVWQACARLEGLPDAVLLDRNQVFSTIGRPMILLRYTPGSNAYYVFGYAGETSSDEAIGAAIAEDIAPMGGRLLGSPAITRWKYFPHYGSADLAAGCLSDLEALQGQRDTWYVGELVANIGVESVASYAEGLVARMWGGGRLRRADERVLVRG